MKRIAKSSITLPSEEMRQIERLQKVLGADSKIEVVRRALKLLQEQTDREAVSSAYRKASLQTRRAAQAETADLDSLSNEGLE